MVRERSLLAACGFIAALAVALGGADGVCGALAAAAGTAFEAAPFLLFSAALGPRLGAYAGLAGCGCARARLPGALSLTAIALCALAFGPLAAAARVAAGGGVLLFRRRKRAAAAPCPSERVDDGPDVFADLEALGASAFLASLAAAAVAHVPGRVPPALAFAMGLPLGAIAPCATAAVALAAAFARIDPALATGVLCTAGLVALPLARVDAAAAARRSAPVACVLLVCALATLAIRGPSGLVSPRLLVPAGCGAILALCIAPRLNTRTRMNALVPALMLAALIAVPRPPATRADATRLADAFAGEPLAFIGLAHSGTGGRTTLTRFAITCCRLDASPVSVRLERALPELDGRWVDATGILVAAPSGELELRTMRVHAIPEPADPFIYR